MRFRNIVFSVLGAYLLIIALSVGALAWRLSYGPVVLELGGRLLTRLVSEAVAPYQVRLVAPRLAWENGRFIIALQELELLRDNQAQLRIKELAMSPETSVFLRSFALLPRHITAESITLVDYRTSIIAQQKDAPAPAAPRAIQKDSTNILELMGLAWRNFDPVQTGAPLRWLEYMEVPRLLLVRAGEEGEQELESSFVRFRRDDAHTNFVFRVELPEADYANQFEIKGFYYNAPIVREEETIPAGGELEMRLSRVHPRSYATLIPEIAFLEQMDFVMDVSLKAKLNEQGHLQSGQAKGEVRAGYWLEEDTRLAVERGGLDLDIDFITQTADLKRLELVTEGNKINLQGDVQYVHTQEDFVESFTLNLSSDALLLNAAQLSSQPIVADRIYMQMHYDLPRRLLEMRDFYVELGDGFARLVGEAVMRPKAPLLVNVRAHDMPITQLHGAQFLPAGVRAVMNEFVEGGIAKNAEVTVKRGNITQAKIDVLSFALQGIENARPSVEGRIGFEQGVLNWVDGLPPVEQATGEVIFTLQDLRIRMNSGEVRRPSDFLQGQDAVRADKMRVSEGRFYLPNYTDPKADAELEFQYEGAARVAAELLASPELELLDDTTEAPFDAKTIRGNLAGQARLVFPNVQSFDPDTMDFLFHASSTDMEAVLFEDYNVRADVLRVDATPDKAKVVGTAFLNTAKGRVVWDYDTDTGEMVLDWEGKFKPEDFNAIDWAELGTRMEGIADAHVKIFGKEQGISRAEVKADLVQAELFPTPLAYRKPTGVPATLEVLVGFAPNERMSELRVDYQSGDDIVRANAQWDENGELLLGGSIAPMRLAPYYDAVGTYQGESDGKAGVGSFRAKRMHISGIIELFEWLNEEVDPDIQTIDENIDGSIEITELVGYKDVIFRDIKGHGKMRDDLYETGVFSLQYGEEERIAAKLVREGSESRRLQAVVSNVGLVASAVEDKERIRNGDLTVDMQLLDKPSIHPEKGYTRTSLTQMEMKNFSVVNLPLFGRLVSLTSLSGLVNLLAGEGIFFDRLEAQVDANYDTGVAFINNAIATGPPVSITAEGAYNYETNEHANVIGTVVPASGVNRVIRAIPIVGWLLAGGEGEGIIGIRYAARNNEEGEINVTVNPLTIFTPSIVRRLLTLSP